MNSEAPHAVFSVLLFKYKQKVIQACESNICPSFHMKLLSCSCSAPRIVTPRFWAVNITLHLHNFTSRYLMAWYLATFFQGRKWSWPIFQTEDINPFKAHILLASVSPAAKTWSSRL